MSIDEVEKYFANADVNKQIGFEGEWWLRSPGQDAKSAAYVSCFRNDDGTISYGIYSSDCDAVGDIYPAIWLHLK